MFDLKRNKKIFLNETIPFVRHRHSTVVLLQRLIGDSISRRYVTYYAESRKILKAKPHKCTDWLLNIRICNRVFVSLS